MTLRVGLAGAGHISRTHLNGWRRADGVTVDGVFDLDSGRAAELARVAGVDRVYTSWEELLERAEVVDVCTPPQTHARLAAEVVAAGRHLLIEKPIVTHLAEWEELSRQIRASEVKVAVVHNLKYTRGVMRAERWVRDGRIGRILTVERRFLTDPAGDRMLAAERHWSHGLPGGRWFETLPHELYLLHHFAGALAPSSVTALRTAAAPPGAPADEVLITLEGADRLATIQYSAACRQNLRTLTLQGTRGRIVVDLLSDAATLSSRGDSRTRRAAGGHLMDAVTTLGRWLPDRLGYVASRVRGQVAHVRLIVAFARHLRGDGPSPTPFEEVDYVVRMAERIGLEIDRGSRRGED